MEFEAVCDRTVVFDANGASVEAFLSKIGAGMKGLL